MLGFAVLNAVLLPVWQKLCRFREILQRDRADHRWRVNWRSLADRLRIHLLYHLFRDQLEIPELNGLSEGLQAEILRCLDLRSLNRMKLVNRSFSMLSKDPKVLEGRPQERRRRRGEFPGFYR